MRVGMRVRVTAEGQVWPVGACGRVQNIHGDAGLVDVRNDNGATRRLLAEYVEEASVLHLHDWDSPHVQDNPARLVFRCSMCSELRTQPITWPEP